MVATTKVYLFACFLVLVIGFYFHRVPRDLNQDIYDYFQDQDYDYFYFALHWPPSFCNTAPNKCRKDATKFTYFTIHGLWPQKQNGDRITCTGPAFNITKLKSESGLIRRLRKFWPNLEAKPRTDESFWRHEWNTHGKCTEWEQNEYFNRTVNVYDKGRISSLVKGFEKHGIQIGESYTIEKYNEAIQNTLGVRSTIQCNNSNTYGTQLLEIRLCVEKTGTDLKDCDLIAFPKWDKISDVHFQVPHQY